MYTLKSIVKRGSMFGAAAAVALSAVMPASMAFADTLNPLTERSLLLSSSAPGFQDTDGSGSSVSSPNASGGNFAPAGSGPNGKKTGQTFSFKVSTDSSGANAPIKAFTFQYCTSAAGKCQAPGNNDGDAKLGGTREADSAAEGESDLNVVSNSPVYGTDYEVYVNGVEDATAGWAMTVGNLEDQDHTDALTGKNNFITLTNATGIQPASLAPIKVVFKASETNYITNPGNDSFFVKLNTYSSELPANHLPTTSDYILDGGVTVANVMTDSIHITTKVLETMSFSVGTKNRETSVIDCPVAPENPGCEGVGATHMTCAPIQVIDGNRLQLGNPNAEYSLETDTAWDVYSYWRLSSNSSGGATVYYSGNTLANTVGDEIAPIGPTAALSTPGTEQFGLGFVDATADDSAPADKFDPAFRALTVSNPDRFKLPALNVLTEETNYANATGAINGTATASFAFEKESNTVPRVIAQNDDSVISCDTAKMRYVANIGADTPAGVYTTKINYLAAPQY